MLARAIDGEELCALSVKALVAGLLTQARDGGADSGSGPGTDSGHRTVSRAPYPQ